MASTIIYDRCACCESSNITKVLDCKDYTVSKEIFEVWQCNNCSFRFTQNVPGEASISPYYQSADYVSHSDTKEGLVNSLYHVVRNHTLKTKRSLTENATHIKRGTLLDVGAGTGAFAHTMQQGGWQVSGLEPDATARANALLTHNIQLNELSSLHQLHTGMFDAITMWHVLEHVHDLHGYLLTFQRILKREGRLIIAVPNYTSYDAEVYNKYWAAYDVPRHLYHFSPASMKVLMQKHDFLIEKIKPMWFDSFYVSMLSEHYKNDSSNFIKAMWIGLMSNIKALFETKKCSSLIYIIRKN